MIIQWFFFRLASLKDSTNPSYKKKTEETVGITLTVKAMMMLIKRLLLNWENQDSGI